MNKKYKFIITILIGILIIGWGIWVTLANSSKTHSLFSETIFEEGDQIRERITYPITENKSFNKKILNMINDEKSTFRMQVNDVKKVQNMLNFIYTFNVHYKASTTSFFYSIHFVISKFVGGAHNERIDKMYYYDFKSEKEIYLSDFFIDYPLALQSLSVLSFEKLKYYYNNDNSLFDIEELKKGLEPIPDNFQYIMFNEDDIVLLFPPYQVGPWSTGEVRISFSYEELNKFLKPEYQIHD